MQAMDLQWQLYSGIADTTQCTDFCNSSIPATKTTEEVPEKGEQLHSILSRSAVTKLSADTQIDLSKRLVVPCTSIPKARFNTSKSVSTVQPGIKLPKVIQIQYGTEQAVSRGVKLIVPTTSPTRIKSGSIMKKKIEPLPTPTVPRKGKGFHKGRFLNTSIVSQRFAPYQKRKISSIKSKQDNRSDPEIAHKHRVNERKRHSDTNDLIELLGSKIPIPWEMRETKVLVLQRIIGYMCFLEKKMHVICEDLNIDAEEFLPKWMLDKVAQQELDVLNLVFKEPVGSFIADISPPAHDFGKEFVPMELLSAYVQVINQYPSVLDDDDDDSLCSNKENILPPKTCKLDEPPKRCDEFVVACTDALVPSRAQEQKTPDTAAISKRKVKDHDFMLCQEVLSDDEEMSMFDEDISVSQKLFGLLDQEPEVEWMPYSTESVIDNGWGDVNILSLDNHDATVPI